MQKAEAVSGAVRHMRKSGALWIVICAFIAGIIMLIIGGNMSRDEQDNETYDEHTYSTESFETYKQGLTSSITASCEKLLGTGNIYVLLDFESSGEIIYAQNSNISSDGDRKDEYVIVGSGSNAEALYLGQKFPVLSGIGIVCPSGVSQSKKDEISALLASAYGLPLTRIYVI